MTTLWLFVCQLADLQQTRGTVYVVFADALLSLWSQSRHGDAP